MDEWRIPDYPFLDRMSIVCCNIGKHSSSSLVYLTKKGRSNHKAWIIDIKHVPQFNIVYYLVL